MAVGCRIFERVRGGSLEGNSEAEAGRRVQKVAELDRSELSPSVKTTSTSDVNTPWGHHGIGVYRGTGECVRLAVGSTFLRQTTALKETPPAGSACS